ncbi:group II intron reverse transcriptase/maturase [Phytohabitans suffuscus]|uniref:Group II intron reverse transcriptase/maturase n=1 Tax=Phytohabitans suffuscus TaxID=624315 RepID=A0A6F8YCH9_9ACTN|nr:group II intron reverse transcriptase/maturase [Phytohabitans suffuscus]BCB83729.1 group II intron reverse transcriptase/maturase [Phytohabitans suffuscus]
MDKPKSKGKPFEISKREVWEAYQKVKTNKGAAGVDGVTIEAFEKDLQGNLYKIWNRMSSGSYFPPPVKAVAIPKDGGRAVRILGVPTVADRIAQTVVAERLEPVVERIFHTDSDGYRVGRSAIDAVAKCRQRCWKYDWVIDLDIQKFFDTCPHELIVKTVAANTDQAWVVLYVQRWLVAPLATPDGALQARDRGTPQGSAASPVLANLFLHYAFDMWMAREFPTIRFERYVDDAVVHCVSKRQAYHVLAAISARMSEVGLALHPTKTKIVYCKDRSRWGDHEVISFTFLGYTFRPRKTKNRLGRMDTSSLPAMSREKLIDKGRQVHRWRLDRRTTETLVDLAEAINPIVRGWMNYWGHFYRSEMFPLLQRINTYLMRWARLKYKRLRGFKRLKAWWDRVVQRVPNLFAHWQWTTWTLPTGW